MKYRLLLIAIIASISHQAYAFNLIKWFENTNQEALRLMKSGQFEAASEKFTRPDWQATALYRAGQYEKAAKQFNAQQGADGLYNQGNALAQQRQFEAAIQAYENALKLEPTHEDAKFNRELLKKWLENQKNQQNQQDQDKQPQEKNKNESDAQNQQKQQNQQDSQKSDEQNQKAQQKEEPKEEETPNAQPQDKQKDQTDKQAKANASKHLPTDAQKNQALRLIPDDPGGLLREKFWRDHWRRMQKEQP